MNTCFHFNFSQESPTSPRTFSHSPSSSCSPVSVSPCLSTIAAAPSSPHDKVSTTTAASISTNEVRKNTENNVIIAGPTSSNLPNKKSAFKSSTSAGTKSKDVSEPIPSTLSNLPESRSTKNERKKLKRKSKNNNDKVKSTSNITLISSCSAADDDLSDIEIYSSKRNKSRRNCKNHQSNQKNLKNSQEDRSPKELTRFLSSKKPTFPGDLFNHSLSSFIPNSFKKKSNQSFPKSKESCKSIPRKKYRSRSERRKFAGVVRDKSKCKEITSSEDKLNCIGKYAAEIPCSNEYHAASVHPTFALCSTRKKRRKKRVRLKTASTQTETPAHCDKANGFPKHSNHDIQNRLKSPLPPHEFRLSVSRGSSVENPPESALQSSASVKERSKYRGNSLEFSNSFGDGTQSLDVISVTCPSSPFSPLNSSIPSDYSSLVIASTEHPSLSSASFQPLSLQTLSRRESESTLQSSEFSDVFCLHKARSHLSTTPLPSDEASSFNCSTSLATSEADSSESETDSYDLRITEQSVSDVDKTTKVSKKITTLEINLETPRSHHRKLYQSSVTLNISAHSSKINSNQSHLTEFENSLNSKSKNEFNSNSVCFKMDDKQKIPLVPTFEKKVEMVERDGISLSSLSPEIISVRSKEVVEVGSSNSKDKLETTTSSIKNSAADSRKTESDNASYTDSNFNRNGRSPVDESNKTFLNDHVRRSSLIESSNLISSSPGNLGRVKTYSRFHLSDELNQSFQPRASFTELAVLSDFSLSPDSSRSPAENLSPVHRNVPRFPDFSPTFVSPASKDGDSSDNFNFSSRDKNDDTETFRNRLSSLFNFICVRSSRGNTNSSLSESTSKRTSKEDYANRFNRTCFSCHKRQNSDDSSVHQHASSIRNITSPESKVVDITVDGSDAAKDIGLSDSDNNDTSTVTIYSITSVHERDKNANEFFRPDSDPEYSVPVKRSDSPIVMQPGSVISTENNYKQQFAQRKRVFNVGSISQRSIIHHEMSTTEKLKQRFGYGMYRVQDISGDIVHENVPLILSAANILDDQSSIRERKIRGILETHYESPLEKINSFEDNEDNNLGQQFDTNQENCNNKQKQFNESNYSSENNDTSGEEEESECESSSDDEYHDEDLAETGKRLSLSPNSGGQVSESTSTTPLIGHEHDDFRKVDKKLIQNPFRFGHSLKEYRKTTPLHPFILPIDSSQCSVNPLETSYRQSPRSPGLQARFQHLAIERPSSGLTRCPSMPAFRSRDTASFRRSALPESWRSSKLAHFETSKSEGKPITKKPVETSRQLSSQMKQQMIALERLGKEVDPQG